MMHHDASSSRCIIMLMMHRDDDEQPLHMLKSMCSGEGKDHDPATLYDYRVAGSW
jgi:hypothetical protein